MNNTKFLWLYNNYNYTLFVYLLFFILLWGCKEENSVEPANRNPYITILTPSDGSVIPRGQTVDIVVEASDYDGNVQRVNFYLNGSLEFEDYESPYEFNWNTSNESYGVYNIAAEAVDDDDFTTREEITLELNFGYSLPEAANDGWEVTSPASVGLDSAKFNDLINSILSQENHLIHGIVVIKEGYLVLEHYFEGISHPTWGEFPVYYDRNVLHVLSSVTKSVTATLLAIAVDKGFIPGVEARVSDFYPEFAYMSEGRKNEITVRHLIDMSSGLDWDETSLPFTDPNNDLTRLISLSLYSSDNPFDFILSKSLYADPGTSYLYGGGNTNVVGDIIRKASGMRLDQFADTYLFDPLGINQSWWWLLRDDFVYASGDLALKHRDLAKIGQMLLQRGYWEGEQIISEEWMDVFSEPQFDFPAGGSYWARQYGHAGYSFGWWPSIELYGEKAFAASGWGGQTLIVMPEFEMVVVLTGGSYWDQPFLTYHQIMSGFILPALNDPSLWEETGNK